MWKVFKIKNLREYHDLYLKTDVLLLTDVFEKFIKTCLDYYRFYPLHYFSAPGLGFDAMSKMTKVELQTILMFIYLLKKVREVVYHIFVKDMLWKIINT